MIPARLGVAVVSLLVVALFGLTCQAGAQSYLFNRADFAIGTNPGGVAVGDFNRDSKLDVAITDSFAQTVTNNRLSSSNNQDTMPS
jgi:hypothetical protein